MTPKEGSTVADDKPETPSAGVVVEMPWVLISNQIQQLSTQMNERFNDQRIRFEDRFAQIDKRIDQVDKRIDQVDKRMDGIEARLTFRNSTWITIILAALGIILGVLLAPRL